MKGLSVVFTLALLVLAQELAWRMKQAGTLPWQKELAPAMVSSMTGSADAAPLRPSRRRLPFWLANHAYSVRFVPDEATLNL